jgi:stearoyl-CoA desaturase (delta-9 desaturase)
VSATAPLRGPPESVPIVHSPHVDQAPAWRGALRGLAHAHVGWVAVGMLVPFGLGIALTGSLTGGLTGLLWGGAVRVLLLLLHHVTFSINCEAWHNHHHAFPTSARHGLGRRELDSGAWLISALERCHLAWDVVRISPGHQQAKRGSAVT